ncbi:hypothetical protein [Anaerofustis stercorihominis]|uniref:hypothetical protein n=1 Tax=Anaerofustis stercorihominis TaxID=214853 RepID=UPI00214CE250|nr:hypothetical protein [Anaerofustis stercorihominis]MCR2033859.1 hypothetical protein [Anaerofustis stercorihominis]
MEEKEELYWCGDGKIEERLGNMEFKESSINEQLFGGKSLWELSKEEFESIII